MLLSTSQRDSGRSAKLIILPAFKSECYKKSLSYRSKILWNSLPKKFEVEKWFANFMKIVKEVLKV